MKNIYKKVYDKISMIPIALFIFAGIYEMFIGDILREFLTGDFSWIVPVTQSMLIDTSIMLLAVFFLINGFPKSYKSLNNNMNTKWIATMIIVFLLVGAIILFIIGKLYLYKVLFKINYLIFMGVLLIFCIIQKLIENAIYPQQKMNNSNVS